MFKFFFFFFFISLITHAQNILYETVKDSDAVLLINKDIKVNKITKIDFIETLDTSCFKNYPLPPTSVRFIKHSCNFNSNGFCEHYEWSFAENDSIQKNEVDASSGHFFILNEYNFVYEANILKAIHVSDVSRIQNIVYRYDNDSIYLKYNYYLPSGTLTEKNISFNNSVLNNKIVNSHTGIKKYYFPKCQILNLGIVHSYNIFINGIPATSFLNEKFEQKRFLLEIHPGLLIFFEIGE